MLKPWLSGVTAAIGLLRAAPRPPQPLPVLPWARACGLTPDPGSGPRSVTVIGPGLAASPQKEDPAITTITIWHNVAVDGQGHHTGMLEG